VRPAETHGPVWVILASGPSQNAADIEAVRAVRAETGLRVIAINNQSFAAPWADILYSHDGSWWKTYSNPVDYPDESRIIRAWPGERLCWDDFGIPYGARPVPRERSDDGLGLTGVRSGCNSGYQAMNLAFLRGARLIIGTGFDMQWTGGKRHNHADHPAPMGNFSAGMPALCRRKFATIAGPLRKHGVRVINASRETALDCFERLPLSDALDIAAQFAREFTLPNPAPPATPPAPRGLS